MKKSNYNGWLKRLTAFLLVFLLLNTSEFSMAVSAAPKTDKEQDQQKEDMEIYGNGLNGIYIDIMDEPYTTYAEKDFGEYAYGGEGCAWFASARACEMTGIDTYIWSGENWYEKAYTYYGYTRGQELREKALACYGWHVLVVEKINGKEITVSEGGYSPTGSESGNTWIHTVTKEELESKTKYGGFIGYVYLFEDTKPYDPDAEPGEEITFGWHQDEIGWQYYENGKPLADQWVQVGASWYYMKKNSYMATGWTTLSDGKYYLTESGARVENTWVGPYYLGEGGKMYVNKWTPDGYYVGADGKWIENYQEKGSWKEDAAGWWYRYPDGTYPVSEWEKIDEKWYYFDSTGYMVTGWVKIENAWYYLSEGGARVENAWVGNYYVGKEGVMAVNTWTPDGYYVGADGAWIQDYQEKGSWKLDAAGWWYRYPDGNYPVSKWEMIDDKWYYFDSNGYMAVGWRAVNGYWYYLNEGGDMATGWRNVDGSWYYLNEGGDMAVGWRIVNGSWYYLTESGAMAENVWVGNYYVGNGGAMYKSTWTPDGYYVGEDGAWVPNA